MWDLYCTLDSESVRLQEQHHKLLTTLLFISITLFRKLVVQTCLSGGLPSLLACQIFPCYSADHQAPTVLQILNENLLEVRSRQRNTPQSFLLRRPQSQYLALVDCSQTEESCKATFGKSNTSLQGNGRASPIYCTPQEFCAMITPLVLSGISQPSSGSNCTTNRSPGSRKLDHYFLGLKG